jgi:hypothetical protein
MPTPRTIIRTSELPSYNLDLSWPQLRKFHVHRRECVPYAWLGTLRATILSHGVVILPWLRHCCNAICKAWVVIAAVAARWSLRA